MFPGKKNRAQPTQTRERSHLRLMVASKGTPKVHINGHTSASGRIRFHHLVLLNCFVSAWARGGVHFEFQSLRCSRSYEGWMSDTKKCNGPFEQSSQHQTFYESKCWERRRPRLLSTIN